MFSKDFGQLNVSMFTWTVDLPSGTSVSLKVTDSTGAINYDQAVTIRESCLPVKETADIDREQSLDRRPAV